MKPMVHVVVRVVDCTGEDCCPPATTPVAVFLNRTLAVEWAAEEYVKAPVGVDYHVEDVEVLG